MKYCPQCGQAGLDNHRFCMRCGSDINAAPITQPPAAPAAAPVVPAGYSPVVVAPPSSGSNNKVIWIVLGVVMVPVALAIVGIVAAIAIPNLLRARISANESAAVGSVRTLNTALVTYQATYNHYPETVGALGGGKSSSETSAGLIDDKLAGGTSSGYRFRYEHLAAVDEEREEGYVIHADPINPNSTGVRHFFSDQTGVIRYSSVGEADAESPPL